VNLLTRRGNAEQVALMGSGGGDPPDDLIAVGKQVLNTAVSYPVRTVRLSRSQSTNVTTTRGSSG
jgi:hypothetical protein